MPQHVDVVKNDWLAGIQYPLATITIDDAGAVTVDPAGSGSWDDLAAEVAGAEDPVAALAGLRDRFHGSHLFATAPHASDHCPFGGRPVYLEAEEASGSATPVPAGR